MENNRLRPVAPPRLPSAGPVYDVRFQEQYSNILRLFFDRLVNTASSLIGRYGARFIEAPNGLFFNTAEQMLAAPNTAYPVTFNNTYLEDAIKLQTGSTSRVTVSFSGIYNFQLTAQALSTNSSAKTMSIWIRRNGIDIGYSARSYTISANNQYAPITWVFNIDLQADDYLEMMVSVTDTNLHLHSEVAAAPVPGVPAAVLTVNFISSLPETLPTPP